MDEKWHGTAGGYTNHKCRCDGCRLAWNAACTVRREKYKREGVPQGVEHGVSSTYYHYACRCQPCTEAGSAYRRGYLEAARGVDYQFELEKQGGACGICGRTDKKLVIDHDHVTGEFRGLLCHGCNTGLGKLGDNVEGVQAALDYLNGAPVVSWSSHD